MLLSPVCRHLFLSCFPLGTKRRFGSHSRWPSRPAVKVVSAAAALRSGSHPRRDEIGHHPSRLDLCSHPGVKGPSVTAQLLRSLRFQVFACGAASLSKYKWEIPLAVKSCILSGHREQLLHPRTLRRGKGGRSLVRAWYPAPPLSRTVLAPRSE